MTDALMRGLVSVTDRGAVLYIAAASGGKIVKESTVRSWVSRGNVRRTHDGRIDVVSLHAWWECERQASKVRVHAA